MGKRAIYIIICWAIACQCKGQVVTNQPIGQNADTVAQPTGFTQVAPDSIKLNRKAKPNISNKRVLIKVGVSFVAPTVDIEACISQRVSVGALVKTKLILFRGAKMEPYVRWYFRKPKNGRGFLQVKGVVGLYHTHYLNAMGGDGLSMQDTVGPLPYTLFEAYGGGVEAGYQVLLGKRRRGILELIGGVQYIYTTIPIAITYFAQKMAVQAPVQLGVRFGGWL